MEIKYTVELEKSGKSSCCVTVYRNGEVVNCKIINIEKPSPEQVAEIAREIIETEKGSEELKSYFKTVEEKVNEWLKK